MKGEEGKGTRDDELSDAEIDLLFPRRLCYSLLRRSAAQLCTHLYLLFYPHQASSNSPRRSSSSLTLRPASPLPSCSFLPSVGLSPRSRPSSRVPVENEDQSRNGEISPSGNRRIRPWRSCRNHLRSLEDEEGIRVSELSAFPLLSFPHLLLLLPSSIELTHCFRSRTQRPQPRLNLPSPTSLPLPGHLTPPSQPSPSPSPKHPQPFRSFNLQLPRQPQPQPSRLTHHPGSEPSQPLGWEGFPSTS